MTISVEPIPEGFLARILRAYGMQWTHLAILTGVVFSSFGLEEYLNPGIWILGIVAALGIVFLFDEQITPRFPRVALIAGASWLVLLGGPTLALTLAGTSPSKTTRKHSNGITAYVAFAIGVPLAAMILSYRKREAAARDDLPPSLAEATRTSITEADFVHENVDYSFQLIVRDAPRAFGSRVRKDGAVLLRYELVMDVINRRHEPARYTDIFDPVGADKRFHYVAINDEVIDHDDPRYRFGLGLQLNYDAQPRERFRIVVHAESTFRLRDSEIVGSYLPAARLSIRVAPPPDGLTLAHQSLTTRDVTKRVLPSGEVTLTYERGILPFQGVRLLWAPSNERQDQDV